jgi:hypothetical protein
MCHPIVIGPGHFCSYFHHQALRAESKACDGDAIPRRCSPLAWAWAWALVSASALRWGRQLVCSHYLQWERVNHRKLPATARGP